jgi:four helix bundle protein
MRSFKNVEMAITKLEDFSTYQLAMAFGEKVWNVALNWTQFEKETIGKQLVKAADSVAANLSEGLGRYHFKESKNFGYYSRGSLYESKTWLTKASNRKLITQDEFAGLMNEIEVIGQKINSYINSIGYKK